MKPTTTKEERARYLAELQERLKAEEARRRRLAQLRQAQATRRRNLEAEARLAGWKNLSECLTAVNDQVVDLPRKPAAEEKPEQAQP